MYVHSGFANAWPSAVYCRRSLLWSVSVQVKEFDECAHGEAGYEKGTDREIKVIDNDMIPIGHLLFQLPMLEN